MKLMYALAQQLSDKSLDEGVFHSKVQSHSKNEEDFLMNHPCRKEAKATWIGQCH